MRPKIEYDDENQILTINGQEYSYEVFDVFNAETIQKCHNAGIEYRLKNEDGVLVIQEIELVTPEHP